MLQVQIGNIKLNQIVLLSPQLLTDTILGLDFLVQCKAFINMAGRSMTIDMNGERSKIRFVGSPTPPENSEEIDKAASRSGHDNCISEPKCQYVVC